MLVRHPSTRVDFGLWIVRGFLAVLFVGPWLWSTLQVSVAVSAFLCRWGVDAGAFHGMPGGLARAVYTLTLFVTWDASRFLLHWMMHRSRFLWRFHQVHHSAEVLTPLTLLRVHPVESALYAVRGIWVSGVVSGIFAHLCGPQIREIDILGVNALGFGLNLIAGNLRHSSIFWSYGAGIEKWLISPAQHQLHHARDRLYACSNFGTWLSIWDRAFGTWRSAANVAAPTSYGLEPQDLNHSPTRVGSALMGPLITPR